MKDLVGFFFFFSSRRRHTRCLSDWSSDVCSSDLMDRPSRKRWPKARTRRRGQWVMSLKDDKQQNIQIELDFSSALTGEAREAGREETESSGAMSGTENPASTNRLMEAVWERENLKAALRQGRANKVVRASTE